jgi:hypothetical protein
MGTYAIEVLDVGSQHPSELLFVQDQQVIETLTPYTAQEAFTKGVGARSVDGCPSVV